MANDFDFRNVAAYAQTRRHDLMQEVEAQRLLRLRDSQQPIVVPQLAVSIGDFLISVGTKLKDRYAVTGVTTPFHISETD